MEEQYAYRAFISYSHADEPIARWLHKALETYRLPGNLSTKKSLRPIFRDLDELSASSSLSDSITSALRASEYLIVICSRAGASSKWVNEEARYFRDLGRSDKILCLITDDSPGISISEFLPASLRSADTGEPLAADLRPGGDGKENARLKLVAALLSVPLDTLKQRDFQRRKRRLLLVASAAVLGMAVTSGLAAYAMFQRDRAEEQRMLAEEETRRANETVDTLIEVLRLPDPSESRGNEITARSLLDRALVSVDQRLTQQPLTSAKIQGAIGEVYTGLGLYEQAVATIEGALDVYLEHAEIGKEVIPLYVGLVDALAEFDARTNRYFETTDYVYDLANAFYEPDSLELAGVFEVVGLKEEHARNFGRSREMYDRALTIRQENLGHDHLQVAHSLVRRAGVELKDGRYTEAGDFLRNAMSIFESVSATDHPEYGLAIGDLGLVEWRKGQLEEAKTLFLTALDLRQRTYGQDHRFIADTLMNLAGVVSELGDTADGRTYSRQAILILKGVYGGPHARIGMALNNLGISYLNEEDLPNARATFLESLEIYTELGRHTEHPAFPLNNLGMVAHKEGNCHAALEYYEASMAVLLDVLDENHLLVAYPLSGIADCSAELGDEEKAIDSYRRAYDIRSAVMEPTSSEVTELQGTFAEYLRSVGRAAEAEALLRGND